jgi:hypothetical protein
VAVIIVDAAGVRIEPIPEAPSGLSRLATVVADAIERRRDGRAEKD